MADDLEKEKQRDALDPNPPALSLRRPHSGRRQWLFRVAALVIVIVLPFTALELVLRLVGYGHATGFFERVHAADGDYLVSNESFSLRFFPPQLARWPISFRLKAEKPAHTYRIFILGESAAMGDPEPAYGAGRYLEALLRERYPGVNFEVINTAATAINSHVILPIARDCATQQGDLWIVYVGNNEMVGPYGAATVFGPQTLPPLWSIRAHLAFQRTRTGQFMLALTRRFAGQKTPTHWGGMEMFLENQIGPTDARKATVYHHFERNLTDIMRAGKNSGAQILLSTVAVNLRDCPPLASVSNTNLPAADRARCDQLLTEGIAAQAHGDWALAEQKFNQAITLDPHRAELLYRRAECLLQLTNRVAAREQFQRVCDSDALPFRADSQINDAIRRVSQAAGPGVTLFDAVNVLATNSPTGISGAESFFEHVHLTFAGNYRLARGWAEQLQLLLPAAIRATATNDWLAPETCERRLGLPDWNRSFVIQSVLWRLQRPPLSTQFNNAARSATLEAQLRSLHEQMDPAGVLKARGQHEAAIAQAPNDRHLRENFARFLESSGDLAGASAAWQRVTDLLPENPIGWYQAGRVLVLRRQWGDAETFLNRALALRPNMPEGWLQLGHAHAGQQQLELALQSYDHAGSLQALPMYHVFAGKTLAKMKRRGEAIQRFRQALEVSADCWEAHFAIGDELVADKNIPEAQKEYEAVLRLQPDNAMAHLNVGVALAMQNRFAEALQQFETTLRLDPNNQMAKAYRDRLRPRR